MMNTLSEQSVQVADKEWIMFPGGELEGKRPKALCAPCREQLHRAAGRTERALKYDRPLCFQCYRAELERERAIKAAGELDTASEARFQCALPFEPVNRGRLEMLRAERARARTAMQAGTERFANQRRHAQIDARRALQLIAAGLQAHTAPPVDNVDNVEIVETVETGEKVGKVEHDRVMVSAIHAAELQLPESWLPFVVAR
jgi:hypothetical protein